MDKDKDNDKLKESDEKAEFPLEELEDRLGFSVDMSDACTRQWFFVGWNIACVCRLLGRDRIKNVNLDDVFETICKCQPIAGILSVSFKDNDEDKEKRKAFEDSVKKIL